MRHLGHFTLPGWSKSADSLYNLAALACCLLTSVLPAVAQAQALPDHTLGSLGSATERHLTILRGMAEVIRYGSEPGTVIVGDEAVAGASIASSDILVLTALESGETNIIVLDESGRKMDDITLKVREKGATIIVQRGLAAEAFLCASVCVSTGEPRTDSALGGNSPQGPASAIAQRTGDAVPQAAP